MVDRPYTTPEEDPFSVKPILVQPRHRRSSMLDKWIQDQQRSSAVSGEGQSVQDLTSDNVHHLHPYLAYPDLHAQRPNPSPCASAITLNSYDLVDDDDIPSNPIFREESTESPDPRPSTPTPQRRPNFLGSPSSSFRHLHINLRSNSPNRLSPQSMSSRSSSRMSFLPLTKGSGRSTPKHNRSSSLSTLSTTPTTSMPDFPSPPSKRPSVLGFFSSPSNSQVSVLHSETLYSPSRPSMSSTNTGTSCTSVNTVAPAEDLSPLKPSLSKTEPTAMSFVSSIRSRRSSNGTLLSLIHSTDTPDRSGTPASLKSNSLRRPFAPKGGSLLTGNMDPQEEDELEEEEQPQAPHCSTKSGRPEVAFAASKGGSLSRVAFSSLNSRNQKKKKLVINGIAPNDSRKFEGAKRWCETFGEVSQIVRMPNSDLHVYFKSAEVADTVCRLRAKVYIAGVGSVNLSWYTGNKR